MCCYWVVIPVKTTRKKTTAANNSKVPASVDTTDPLTFIVENDIFTPPSQRVTVSVSTEESEPPPKPQELEITGIVNDGKQYLVSVENRDTREANFIRINETMGEYLVNVIRDNQVECTKNKEKILLAIGDRITLPGTVSSSASSTIAPVNVEEYRRMDQSQSSGNNNSNRFSRRRNSGNNSTPVMAAPPASTAPTNIRTNTTAGSSASTLSIEEKLRRRRQQQEESLR